jgi:serine/threonine protein kinase
MQQRHGRQASAVFLCVDDTSPVVVKVSWERDDDCWPHPVYSALRRWPHPNLIQSNSMFVAEGIVHIVLPYLRSGDLLESISATGPLSEPKCLRLLLQLVQALHHLHAVIRVAHMDISPENVLLGDGGAVLIDYGSCCGLGDGTGLGQQSPMTKPQYMAPELLDSRAATSSKLDLAKADVFALGLVFFIALFGFPPIRKAVLTDPLFNVLKKKGVSKLLIKIGMGAKAKAVAPEILSLLDAMLRADPDQRISIDGILLRLRCYQATKEQSKRPPGCSLGVAPEQNKRPRQDRHSGPQKKVCLGRAAPYTAQGKDQGTGRPLQGLKHPPGELRA